MCYACRPAASTHRADSRFVVGAPGVPVGAGTAIQPTEPVQFLGDPDLQPTRDGMIIRGHIHVLRKVALAGGKPALLVVRVAVAISIAKITHQAGRRVPQVHGHFQRALLPHVPPSWTADCDRERYAEISLAIKSDENHLVGKSLDDVIGQLRLENVPWDIGFTMKVDGEYRIYHFRGFALYIDARLFPPGITPNSGQRWTCSAEELHRDGVLWLDHLYPSVQVDGITDPNERMRQHWEAIDEQYERLNAEMERKRRRNAR